jgi:hypothetical protein
MHLKRRDKDRLPERSVSAAKAQLPGFFTTAEATAESARYPARQRALAFEVDQHLLVVKYKTDCIATYPLCRVLVVKLDECIAL